MFAVVSLVEHGHRDRYVVTWPQPFPDRDRARLVAGPYQSLRQAQRALLAYEERLEDLAARRADADWTPGYVNVISREGLV